jgi:hypothetical protein
VIFDSIPTWLWFVVGGGIAAIVMLRCVFRRADKRAREHENLWVRQQFAEIIAQKTGASVEEVLKRLKDGNNLLLPPEFDTARVWYQRTPSSGSRIRKGLEVVFQGKSGGSQKVTREVECDWTDLPGDIRADLIRTRRTVIRAITFPSGIGR